MKTLILGAKGMLGHELARVFIKYKPFLWDMDEIDITNQTQVNEKISDLAPELIINAAAYTNVDACETNEELATKVNGTAVGYLAEAAAKIGATLVHYSTDYVFDGSKKEGYNEDDEPNPINAYARSKLVGEQAILSLRGSVLATEAIPESISGLLRRPEYGTPRNDNPCYYIIRTAWLYGVHGKNFVETMLALAEKGKPIKVVDDQIGSPTYAVDLAQATLEIVEAKKPAGIYHRTGSGQVSWYGFAKEIFEVFGYTVSLRGVLRSSVLRAEEDDEAIPLKNQKVVNLSPCTTAEYSLPAKRPAWSVLNSAKLAPMRSWQEALRAYARERDIDNTK